jgi:hypothetical protein
MAATTGVGGCPGCTMIMSGPSAAGSNLGLTGSDLGLVFYYFNKTIFCVGRSKRPPPLISIFGIGLSSGDFKNHDFLCHLNGIGYYNRH